MQHYSRYFMATTKVNLC